jgi:hypothetical protein
MYEKNVYQKPNGSIVKITMSEFRGIYYTHIREYQMDGDTGNWFPTKSGYALLTEEVDSIIEALQESSECFAKVSRTKYDTRQLDLFKKEEY